MRLSRSIVPALFIVVAVGTAVSTGHAIAVAVDHPSLGAVLVTVYYALRTSVALAFAAFTVRRAEPHRRARGLVALVACAVAMVAIIAFDAPNARTTAIGFVLAGDIVAVVSCVWLLAAVLALGRCFGVLPEARGLVTRGPYRLVRHPVYLGEIGACVGLALAAPSVLNGAVVLVIVAAQAVRMGLEERALTEAFPGYAQYAERTARVIPRIVPLRSRRSRYAVVDASAASPALRSTS